MQKKIYFSLPADDEQAKEVLARLADLLELINMEKDEQAIEPAFFKGNMADYPEWFVTAFDYKDRLGALEKACGYEAGDLDDWDMESWYDDLFAVPSYKFAVQGGTFRTGEHELVFELDENLVGGEKEHAWLLFAAGAQHVRL